MVSGHNLEHMAPFGILTTGFCMVLRCEILICLFLGTIFGTPDPQFRRRWVPAGPVTFLGQRRAPKKMAFHKGSFPKGLHGIRAGGMDRMVPRRPLGRPVSPQTL